MLDGRFDKNFVAWQVQNGMKKKKASSCDSSVRNASNHTPRNAHKTKTGVRDGTLTNKTAHFDYDKTRRFIRSTWHGKPLMLHRVLRAGTEKKNA